MTAWCARVAFGGLLVGMTCYYLLLSRLIVHCQVDLEKILNT